MLLLDKLIERSRHTQVLPGYAKSEFSVVLHVGKDGTFKGIEVLDEPRTEIVPTNPVRTSSVVAMTAIDNALYTLGAAPPGRSAEWVAKRHQAYLGMLSKIDHPACRLIEKALAQSPAVVGWDKQVPTQAQLAQVMEADEVQRTGPGKKALIKRGKLTPNSQVVGAHKCAITSAARYVDAASVLHVSGLSDKSMILIDVEGHEQWWCDPAVDAVHTRRRLEANNREGTPRMWPCSLCGETRTITRLFRSSHVLSGGLISFNGAAWSGYNRKQGRCAPTCMECAERIGIGLDAILRTPGTLKWLGGEEDYRLVWWADDPGKPGPWPALSKALDMETPDEDAEELLSQITAGQLISLTQQEKRLSLRRHVQVDPEVVRERVMRWRRVHRRFLGEDRQAWPVSTAHALRFDGATRQAKLSNRNPGLLRRQEMIYLYLLGGQPFCRRETNWAQALLDRQHPDDHQKTTNLRRAAFLTFAGAPYQQEKDMEFAVTAYDDKGRPIRTCRAPEESNLDLAELAVFYLGRALARAADNQTSGGRSVQTRVDSTYSNLVKRRPGDVYRIIKSSYSQYEFFNEKTQRRTKVDDKVMEVLLSRTVEFQPLNGLPAPMDPRQCVIFDKGYYFQRFLRDAYMEVCAQEAAEEEAAEEVAAK